MKKQSYEMEYIKIEDSGQRSFGQKKNHTIIFVTGGMGYLRQENEKAVCTMEDLIFIKPDNKVKIEYRKNKYPLELYVLYVGTELLQSLSDENTRLDEAFDIVPFQVKTVHSESESAMLIKNISKKLFWMRDGGKPQVWNIAVWGVSLLCKDMRFFICKRIIEMQPSFL